jgi:translation initiation factor IF-3
VIDEKGENLGVMSRAAALAEASKRGLDLIEIAATAKPPVARIMSFDKFRYHQNKEERKQRLAQRGEGLKQIRITVRAAKNDLEIRLEKTEEFLAEGYKVEINLALRGREKKNKEWALQKMKDFLAMVKSAHTVTLPPREGGRGFIAQITKK